MPRELEATQQPVWRCEPARDPVKVLRAGQVASLGGLVRQLADLADLAGDVFSGLAGEIGASARRTRKLGERCQGLHARLQGLEAAAAGEQDVRQLVTAPGIEWKAAEQQSAGIDVNLFSLATAPAHIQVAYAECRRAPPLELLDRFAAAGPSCAAVYSDPQFCIREFEQTQLDEAADRAALRREKRRLRRAKQAEQRAGAPGAKPRKATARPRRASVAMRRASVTGLSPAAQAARAFPEGPSPASSAALSPADFESPLATPASPVGSGRGSRSPSVQVQSPNARLSPPPVPLHLIHSTPHASPAAAERDSSLYELHDLPDFSGRVQEARAAAAGARRAEARAPTASPPPRTPEFKKSPQSLFLYPPVRPYREQLEEEEAAAGGPGKRAGESNLTNEQVSLLNEFMLSADPASEPGSPELAHVVQDAMANLQVHDGGLIRNQVAETVNPAFLGAGGLGPVAEEGEDEGGAGPTAFTFDSPRVSVAFGSPDNLPTSGRPSVSASPASVPAVHAAARLSRSTSRSPSVSAPSPETVPPRPSVSPPYATRRSVAFSPDVVFSPDVAAHDPGPAAAPPKRYRASIADMANVRARASVWRDGHSPTPSPPAAIPRAPPPPPPAPPPPRSPFTPPPPPPPPPRSGPPTAPRGGPPTAAQLAAPKLRPVQPQQWKPAEPSTPTLFAEADFVKQLQQQRNKLAQVQEDQLQKAAPQDSRTEMLSAIKSHNFNLRKMTLSFQPGKGGAASPLPKVEETSAQLNVATIMEKAKLRRIAMEGSDEEDDSDVSEDDDW